MGDSHGAAAFISDGATGSPQTVTGVEIRRSISSLLANATSRAFGARSGRRAGAGGVPTISGTTVSLPAGAAVVDAGTGGLDSAFLVSWGSSVPTMTGTPADSSQPRVDVVYVRVDEVLGAPTTQTITFGYQAGTAASTPSPPSSIVTSGLPTVGIAQVAVLGYVNVPASGGGAATVTPGPVEVAAGGVLPVLNSTEYPSAPYRGQMVDHPSHGMMRWDGSGFGDPDPRGEISYTENTTQVDVIGGATTLLTSTVPVIGGRKYKATAFVEGIQITVDGSPTTISRAYLTGPFANKYCFYDVAPPINKQSSGTAWGRWSVGGAGTLTFTVVVQANGTGGLRLAANTCSLLVEDMGQGV